MNKLGPILLSACCLASCVRSETRVAGASSSPSALGPEQQTAPRAAAAWEVGKEYVYSLQSKVMVDFGSAANTVSYDLAAAAHVTVLERQAERSTLHLRLVDVSLKDAASKDPPKDVPPGGKSNLERLATELGEGDAVFVLSGGRMVEFGLRRQLASPAAATYRQIAGSLQVTLAPDGKDWQAQEYDTTGEYVARYTVEEGSKTYLKSKLRYLALLGKPKAQDGTPLPMVPEVRKSEGKIRLSPAGVPESVELLDELTLAGAQMPIHSSNSVRLRLVKARDGALASQSAALLASFSLRPASEPDTMQTGTEALDRARTRGATFREILSQIEASQAAAAAKAGKKGSGPKRGSSKADLAEEQRGPVDASLFTSLVGALRTEKGAVDRAVALIKGNSPNASIMIDALGSASNQESEAALIGLVDAKGLARGLKDRLLFAMARMPKPSDKSVELMKSILKDAPYDASALYALGSYSRGWRDTGESARAAEVGKFLVDKLSAAAGPMDKTTALRAIQNSGYAPAIASLRPYLDDRDETVRSAAFRALGPMNDASVEEILVSRFRSDTSSESRLVLIEVAKKRAPSPKLVAAVGAVSTVPDANVRYRAVEALAAWLPSEPAVRPLLEKIGQADSEPRIRAIAQGAR